jgi:hypothetical protein
VRDDVPPDPFSGDPDDPASAFGDDRAAASLSQAERQDVLADLADLGVFRALLEPTGIRGLAITCDECDDTHYIAWELLSSGLAELAASGVPHVHEPAFDPAPTDYVSWDYARGYVDGVIDTEGRGEA